MSRKALAPKAKALAPKAAARNAKSSGSPDLIGRITDTIADHPRVSAAAAFQMGVLLGQAMQHTGALKSLGKTMASAPGALVSSIPTFGFFDGNKPAASRKPASRPAPRVAKRGKRSRSA